MDIYQRLRKNLRLLRTEQDLSAKEFSVKLGWVSNRIADIEDTNRATLPRLDELEQICVFFGITIDDLFHKEAFVSFK